MNPDTEILYAQVPEREHNIFRERCPRCDERSTTHCQRCEVDVCSRHIYGYESELLCGECYEIAAYEDWLANSGRMGQA